MIERISRGPHQAVRDDGLQEFETIEVADGARCRSTTQAGNKETALLLKMPDSRVGSRDCLFSR